MGEYQFTRTWIIEANNEKEARILMDDEIQSSAPLMHDDFEVTCLDPTYRINRFHEYDPPSVVNGGLTLAEAQAWCRREDTHGVDSDGARWFDGYEAE